MLSCPQRPGRLKKIYKAYQPAGLEILTVYSGYGQQVPKELLQKEKLPWLAVIDNGVGESKVSTQVKRTPDNVFFDQNKRIIARDLSPDELATTLSELVKK
ncbi:TlpA family protein disulfide reductase [Spirosoma aerolatum]|uniref:TlpA family protein disulfide reductase n=1 Tax=Spirosoma aerolatum TaxID=1211326 RepID=UPI0009AC3D69|nr:hypothetical protein [Spirosoma aerolatum]